MITYFGYSSLLVSINTTLGITIMATMILRDTHRALEEKMKELDKQKKETAIKILELVMETLKKMVNITPPERAEFYCSQTQTLQTHSPFQIIEYAEIDTNMVGFGNKVSICEEGKTEMRTIS